MAIKKFSKWRPFVILDFWYSNFLTVEAVERPILYQYTKFRKHRSNHCGDIAIIVILQSGSHRHLGFSKKNWYFNDMSAVRGQHASPCQISSTSVKSLHTYGFLNGGRPPSWICWARLGPPLMTTWWSLTLYRCAKFGWNRCSSFDNIKLSMFCTFGLKTPIHAPKVGLLEEIGSYIKKPKGTPLHESASFKPSSVKIRRRSL